MQHTSRNVKEPNRQPRPCGRGAIVQIGSLCAPGSCDLEWDVVFFRGAAGFEIGGFDTFAA